MSASEHHADAIEVGTFDELKRDGVRVVGGERRRIAVFADGDRVFAVENNCPHMGFPLDRGTVRDGMLTCHWHQARFDLRSGCTFDLWADDVPRYEAWIDADRVYVARQPTHLPDVQQHRARLLRGLEQNIGLVQAKSILALLESGASLEDILRDVVEFASRNLAAMSEGLTRLVCVARLYPKLDRRTAYQALYYAIRRIGEETAAAVPRRRRDPLLSNGHDLETLRGWLAQWVQTRHRDGAERTLLTGVRLLPAMEVAELLFAAATERLYANGGHLLEDCNKICELVELLGSDHGETLMPLVIPRMTDARGAEESTNWHHPVEIVEPLNRASAALGNILQAPRDPAWRAPDDLLGTLLGDDPLASIEALAACLSAGAAAPDLARHVAYAAALRLARFATSNEVTDWFNPQHTFIYCNGAYQAARRSSAAGVVRGIFHGAVSVYMDRYLNVPPARLPGERAGGARRDSNPSELLDMLLDQLDKRSNIDEVADTVHCYVAGGADLEPLIDRLALATVREDIDFHSLQVLEAGVNQIEAWGGTGPEVEHILIGVARNLAAHCPTRRAGQQTALIAERLQRGEKMFED